MRWEHTVLIYLLAHAPITPNFSYGFKCEIARDYVQN
jgi:hypothetical protein